MSAIDKCQIETVELALRRGIKLVPGHRFLDFAAHRCIGSHEGEWGVTHLPSGMLMCAGFLAADGACEAMVEIARLRNDWAIIWEGDPKTDLKKQVDSIAQKYFGFVTDAHGEGKWPPTRLNKYESAE